MGWRGTILLLVLLGAAVAYLYRDANAGRSERSWEAVFAVPTQARPADAITPLLRFDPRAVTAVTLQGPAGTWRSERTASGWSGVARPAELNDFLAQLAGLAEVLALEPDAEALPAQGLAPPRARIELTRREGPPLVLLVGGRNPPGTAVYARLGDAGRVVLTGALLHWELEKAERALREAGAADGPLT